ncbi:MAG: serine/threonine-protein kinase [Pseudomonadota bacterium]
MNTDEWQLLRRVFDAALNMPEDEREAFVRQELDSADLQAEALALLQAALANDTLSLAPAEERDLPPGTPMGAYRIVEKIGDGGMGAVYRAERADGAFERQVAIKVVRQSMLSEAVAHRFDQERAILARLEHPNIAAILDGGMTDEGGPYFVMELVEGLAITDYCDLHKLSIQGRLRLFTDVCRAVQFAHQNFVVHRDLKPSNILVNEAGVPKLLDFGIAKVVEGDPDAAELDMHLTKTGVLLATPAYAAPEQLASGNITTMTDVYALGVLLYELLTGRRPFEPQRTPDEFLLMLLNDDPIRPSTALTQMPMSEAEGVQGNKTAQTVSASRQLDIGRLRSTIRGDLDNICLTAIRRNPDARYATAGALADDITRHLSNEPINARGHSLGYRLRKFYRRHTAAVTGAVAAGVFLLSFGVYHTNRVTVERDIALAEQAKTQEVVQFVTGLFQAADPAQARGTEVTARELLDAGLQQIETQMGNRPDVQAVMKRVLGEVYYQLGEQEQAGRLLQDALAIQRSVVGEDSLEVADTLLSLGMQQQTIGDFPAAQASLDQALALRRSSLGAVHPKVMDALSAQAFYAETVGEYVEAEALHKQALQMAQQLAVADEDLWVATQQGKLASVLRLQDRLDEAEELLQASLTTQEKIYRGAHPESDETKRQLAELLIDRRKYEESEVLFKELIASRTKMLGPDHYETGSAWNSYGHLLSAKGDRQGAIDAYTRMLNITRSSYGDTHPALAAGYNNVAIIRRNEGDFTGALRDFESSLAMLDAVGVDPEHPNRAYPLSGKARIFMLLNEFENALQTIDHAIEIRRKQMADDHILLVELFGDRGAILAELGRFAEAEVGLTSSYTHLVDNWGMEDARTGMTAARLVRLYQLTDDPGKAEQYLPHATPQEDDVMLQYY